MCALSKLDPAWIFSSRVYAERKRKRCCSKDSAIPHEKSGEEISEELSKYAEHLDASPQLANKLFHADLKIANTIYVCAEKIGKMPGTARGNLLHS